MLLRQILTLVAVCLLSAANATHIVGGGFDLQHISGSTYRLTFTMLRDCQNGEAQFNSTISVGIFNKETNEVMDTVIMITSKTANLNPTKPGCVKAVPGCVEKAIYTSVISLPAHIYNNTQGYYFSWERCCRNHIIQNIQQPGGAAITYYMEVPSPNQYKNSTPQLVTNPFTVMCRDNHYNEALTFTDSDNDSLAYEIITPVNGTLTRDWPNDDNRPQRVTPGPYSNIVWMEGYNAQAPIPGSPPLNINPLNGMITAYPTQVGVFAFAVRVTEFRNGVLIGLSNWELQYTVIACDANTPPRMELFQGKTQITQSNIYVRVPGNVTFSVKVFDADKLDTVIVISGFSNDTSNAFYLQPTVTKADSLNAVYSWTWQTNCNHNKNPSRQIKIIATDKGCPIPKTAQYIFNVNVLSMFAFPSTDVLCLELKENKATTIYFGDSSNNNIDFAQFILFRSINNQPFEAIDSTSNYTQKYFSDDNTPNYTINNYRYFIKTQNKCGVLGASSDTLGTFDQLKAIPDKQYVYNATVVGNKTIAITWNKTPEKDFARYFLHKGDRAMGDSLFPVELDFKQLNDTFYVDEKVDVSKQSYCYYVVMLDTCGNYGPAGEKFCTVFLKGETKPFEHYLTWEKFIAHDDFKCEYEPLRNISNSPEQLSLSLLNDNVFTTVDDKLNYDYSVFEYSLNTHHTPAKHINKTAVSQSNSILLAQKPIVYVPNAFTPNNDNINDTWYVSDAFVHNFEARVYNAWGQLVFETIDKNNKWNGNDTKGVPVPAGVYVYHITYDGWDSFVKIKTGNLTVIK